MLVLSTLTMNASGILIKKLGSYSNLFDKIFICDGDLSDEAENYYSQFPKVSVLNYPWDDNYVSRYTKNADAVEYGDFILHLDDDELISSELQQFLAKREFEGNMYWLPCVLHLTEDGKNYYPAEKKPKLVYEGQWTKRILYRKNETLDFKYAGSHVIPENQPYRYIPYPYYHLKSLESFVLNDLWQGFLNPKAQGYNPVQAAQFKLFVKQYKTTKEFKEATINGRWPEPLKRFAWENRWMVNSPVSRLAWAYWIVYNHERPQIDEKLTWDNVKNYILSKETMNTFNKAKAENQCLNIL